MTHCEKAEIRCLMEFTSFNCVSYLKLSLVAKYSRVNYFGHPTSEVRTNTKYIVAKRHKQKAMSEQALQLETLECLSKV